MFKQKRIYSEISRRIYVDRLTRDISERDLQNHFSKFGEITDVCIPKPFGAYAVVTFDDASTAESLCGKDHILRGVPIHISNYNMSSQRRVI